MALSFFGRKPASRARDSEVKAAEEKSAPSAPELSTLDFSAGGDYGRALAQCVDAMEVQEAGEGLGSAVEDAAVLYANGNDAEAEKVLNTVLDDPALGGGEGLWLMLLDLYRLTGQKARFESRVLDYAARFEKSPPPWEDLSGSMRRKRPDSAAPLVNLAGTLSVEARSQFGQIGTIGRKTGAVRIDFSRLRGITPEGCELLLETLKQLAKAKVKVLLFGVSQLAGLVQSQIKVEVAENEPMWLLLLQLLQYGGEQERFEEVAVDYAVTFEVSPPSWENIPQPEEASVAEAAPADEGEGLRFEGEINASNVDTIRSIAAEAGKAQMVEVDCTTLRRMDFVSAGTLFNIVAGLQGQGKLVVLKNVNGMVAGLLRVMGVDQVAQVLLRN